MNFVIVSRNFWPQRDPEAYCTTRFASALAKRGHSVHVITAQMDARDYENSYKALVHPDLKITRVPIKRKRPGRIPRFSVRNLILDNDVLNLKAFIATTKNVLRQYDNPILVSRTLPLLAMYVGWRCRRLAHRWVLHISDPLHWERAGSRMGRLRRVLEDFWLRRVLKKADMISVTCARAIRYYKERYPQATSKCRWTVTTHIGDQKLFRPNTSGIDSHKNVIAHFGDMYSGRGGELVEAVEDLNREGFACELIQDRKVIDPGIKSKFDRSKHCRYVAGDDSCTEKNALKCAKVSAVIDFNPDLPYSPFLMSKFVYQVYEDRPIVVMSKKDSAKHDYCLAHPEAGLYFAELGDLAQVKSSIRLAFSSCGTKFDRSRIREEFCDDKVASAFEAAVTGLL